jgi:hypothetical protein
MNLLQFVNKERGENSNLVKICGGTKAHLLTRRCYNVFLTDRCINTHSTVIVVCFVSVVIELKGNFSQNQWMANDPPYIRNAVTQSGTRSPCNVSGYWEHNIFIKWRILQWGRDSSVGITTGYGLDDLGSIPENAKFFSSQRSDRLWGPPSLISKGNWGILSWGYSGSGVKLTTHIYLLPRSRKVELYLHFNTYLHGVVLN